VGALISYGTSVTATYPRVLIYVDRILKGAKPADTPIEVVSKRELVINAQDCPRARADRPARVVEAC
jgi:putative ABC transport system substrate-binding protein